MKVFATTGPDAPLQEMEIDSPSPTGRQVLLRVTHSGVCHTDTHSHSGGYDLGDGAWLSIADRGLEYPAVFGHEIVGEVIAVGPDAQGVQPGDSRIVFPWIGCGECSRCLAGDSNLCATSRAIGVFRWGGFATEVLVPDSDFLVDHEGLDPSWAATLACSGLTSYSSVRRVLPLTDEETVRKEQELVGPDRHRPRRHVEQHPVEPPPRAAHRRPLDEHPRSRVVLPRERR